MYPFATIVAERFGRGSQFRTPKVESTGSGGGIKLFCDGIGNDYPDVVNASREMTDTEFRRCRENGVRDIAEVRFGYDGIILANAVTSAELAVTSEQLFLALARRVPGPAPESLVDNPNLSWRDIDGALPDQPIEVYGPPPTSGTRDAFVELVLEAGCVKTPWIAALRESNPAEFRAICHSVREDGRYIEAGENDNLVVQRLESNPGAFGIVGFSFVDQNPDLVKGAVVDGVAPSFESVATLEYPISRPLYFYVKKQHLGFVPGLSEFVSEFTAERAFGDLGYLSYRGLVPLPAAEREKVTASVAELGSPLPR